MESLFIEIFLFTLFGIGFGIVTGLTPGIHINMVAAILISSIGFLSNFSALSIVAALIAMSVVHSFLDYIPSILLGAPDEDTALSILPGHRMLLAGRAMEAIKLTALGSLIAMLVTAGLFAFILKFLPVAHGVIKPYMHFLLLFVVMFGIILERKPASAMFVFLLAGFYGVFLLNSNMFTEEIIFPALSGLFGISTMLLSLKEKVEIPKQKDTKISMKNKQILKSSLLGTVAGMIVGLLPGIGSAQATYIVQQASKKSDKKGFLIATSSVGTANIIIPLFVLYTLGKTRSGIVIAINKILSVLTADNLMLFIAVVLFSGGIATFLHLKIGKKLTILLSGKSAESYKKITLAIIVFITLTVLLLTGISGVLILILGTCIGLIPPLIGVRRAQCMGFFVFPVMLFYSGLNIVLLSLLY